MSIQLVTLDLKSLNINAAQTALMQKFIIVKIDEGEVKVAAAQFVKAQKIIDDLANQMPDLLPVQFHYLLNKYGFDLAIKVLLPPLRDNDLDRYAIYKAYLEQARFYEYDKTYAMFLELKSKFEEVDPSLGIEEERFKVLWREATSI